jgi:hypothetical protein
MSLKLRRSNQLSVRDNLQLSQSKNFGLSRGILYRGKKIDWEMRRSKKKTAWTGIPEHMFDSWTSHKVSYNCKKYFWKSDKKTKRSFLDETYVAI